MLDICSPYCYHHKQSCFWDDAQQVMERSESAFENAPGSIVDRDEVTQYTLQHVVNRVVLGDSLKVLPKLEAECVDMVFIDPPYFLRLPRKELKRWRVKTVVEGVDDGWDRFASVEEYDTFIQNLLMEAKRVMKPTATIWVIGTYHNIFWIGKILQDLGFWILNDVVWVKTNPMPIWLGARFTNATENLIWAVKDKGCKGYTFHREYAREFGIGRVGANVWMLPVCNGKERMREGKERNCTLPRSPWSFYEE